MLSLGGQKSWKWRFSWAAAMAIALLMVPAAGAVFLDQDQTFRLTGKLSNQESWRASRPSGFTSIGSGSDLSFGNLIQSRYQADLELLHDLRKWLLARGMNSPFAELRWLVRIAPTYDGITDYGPSKLDPDDNPGNQELQILDHLKLRHNAFPWNAYVDIGVRPVHFRVGRQDLSWGESDGFRISDMIEPLDNRFGFALIEDLDDRRIPLWMLRAVVDLRFLDVGPLSNSTFEAFWAPGWIERTEAPINVNASPFGVNSPPSSVPSKLIRPHDQWSGSRGGGRFLFTLFQQATVSLVHYYTWNDFPGVVLRVDPRLTPGPTGLPVDITSELHIFQQQVSAATFTGAVPFDPVSILRAEVGMFWSERVLQASDISPEAVGGLIFRALTTQQSAFSDPHNRNVLRWMLGVDRNTWIRFLNRKSTFFFTGQWLNTHVLDAPGDATIGLPNPDTLKPDPIHPWEILFTGAVSSPYWNGWIVPQQVLAYDPRGVWAVVPGVQFNLYENWIINLKYANVLGHWHGLGFFKDRDVFFLKVTYSLS